MYYLIFKHHSYITFKLQDFKYNSKILSEIFKIGIPNSEEVDGKFAEKIGIFRDVNGNSVTFSGTSTIMLSNKNRNYESIDVFTSWNDKSRCETKIDDFENLWTNNTESVQVFDFEYAERNNLLKYSSEWAVSTN